VPATMGDQSDDQLLKELEVGSASFDVVEMAQLGPERPQSGIRGLKSSRLRIVRKPALPA